jgi:ELWxxDGT repeat protein
MLRQTALFNGTDTSGNNGLWITNGTAAGTHEVTGISGAYSGGLFSAAMFTTFDLFFAVFNGEVLFNGTDTSGNNGLWITNGTAAGTHEVTGISGAYSGGIFFNAPPDFTVFNSEVLFEGADASGGFGLWMTNGTAAGTTEVGGIANSGVSGASSFGLDPFYFTVFNGEVLFAGLDASEQTGLWITDGTAAGTMEVGGIANSGVSGASSFGLDPVDLTVFNSEVLFAGLDASVNNGLWVTNGTAAGTFEVIGISGAYSGGVCNEEFGGPPDLAVFNGEVLFNGRDTSGNNGLWITNGTAAGTTEVGGIANSGVSGANTGGIFNFLSTPDFTVLNGEVVPTRVAILACG